MLLMGEYARPILGSTGKQGAPARASSDDLQGAVR